MKHLLLTAFVISILFLGASELERQNPIHNLSIESSLMGDVTQVVSKDKAANSERTGKEVIDAIIADKEDGMIWQTESVKYSMDHKERENLRDWVDYFTKLADEEYTPRIERIYVGKNPQGFHQYMFINGKNERVLQWYDEEGISVEQLVDGEQAISRFYGYESGKIDLVKVVKDSETVSLEFSPDGSPKYLWVKEQKTESASDLFFQFHPDGRMKSRYYKIGKMDWQECPLDFAKCQLPSFR